MAEAESLETAAEHERILREIESTDTACIGPTLRYPACRGWTGEGMSETGAGSFGVVCAAGRPQGRRRPLPAESRAGDLHPWRGGSRTAAPEWGPFPIVFTAHLPRKLLPPPSGLGQLRSPSEASPAPGN